MNCYLHRKHRRSAQFALAAIIVLEAVSAFPDSPQYAFGDRVLAGLLGELADD